MDDFDFYYVDDARNARVPRVHSGTVNAGTTRPGVVRPGRPVVVQPAAPATGYGPAFAPQQPPAVYYPPSWQVAYGEPNPTAGSLLGRLTGAQLIEIGTQLYAAMKALPPPPNPTSDLETNAQNSILYLTALAQHAKQNDQWRTLGSLAAKMLVG